MKRIPKHIGIILDGNRRFAKRLMKEPWKGHEFGAEKVEKLFEWCRELNIKEMTLYCFSIQNFNRPKKEFDYLMKIFNKFFGNAKTNKKIHENNIRIKFIGRIHLFPEKIYQKMKELEETTKGYSDYKINFAMAYGGREEIIDAVKMLGKEIKNGNLKINEISEKAFLKFLYLDSEPDLIIRTGGEHRTSNFLVWQSAYSEWIFLKKTWPEFEKEDLTACIEDFTRRERRFGR